MDNPRETLLELQKIDSRIVEIEGQLKAYPKRIKSLDVAADQAREELAATSKRLMETRVRRGLAESEIAEDQATMQKFTAQQMQVKTNKEYQAITHQISTLEEAIGEKETVVLELLEQEDETSSKVEERNDDLRHAEREASEEKVRLGALEAEKREDLTSLRQERDALIGRLSEGQADTYETLFARFPGEAIRGSNGQTCGGCHMNLLASTAQILHETDNLAPCSHCGRLLFKRSD